MPQNNRHYSRAGTLKQTSSKPAQTIRTVGTADPALLQAQQAQRNRQARDMLLTSPYLSAEGGTLKVINPATQAPEHEKNKPKALGFADPGLLAAQQPQEMIKTAPYLHMKGPVDTAQPAKVPLTKEEELSPYLSVLNKPKALGFADPGLLAAQQPQETIKTAPYLL